MASKAKVSAKLAKVNENFTINMYDNGYMIEIGGRDKEDDWKTSKILVDSLDDLIEIVREVVAMERVDSLDDLIEIVREVVAMERVD